MPYTLPPLPYSYSALEPAIDAQTMEIHHSKHHQAYIDKLNAALANHPDLAAQSLEDLLSNLNALPEDIRTAICNNGGGHYNHSLFWQMMRSPLVNNEPQGALLQAINSTFKDFATFKKEFATAGLNRFGSGWAWLVINNGQLRIISTPSQDSPIMEGKKALLGLDVWEHAYYLKYQNRRPEYIENWWPIVNWDFVAANFGS